MVSPILTFLWVTYTCYEEKNKERLDASQDIYGQSYFTVTYLWVTYTCYKEKNKDRLDGSQEIYGQSYSNLPLGVLYLL